MKILLVTQYFWPENFRINDLIKELRKKKISLTVLTNNPTYPNKIIYSDFYKNKKKYRKFYKSKIIRFANFSRSNNSAMLLLNYIWFVLMATIVAILHLRKIKFDLVFVYAPSPITVAIPAIIFSKIKKIPLVLWVLDLWPETLKGVGVVNSRFLLNAIAKIVSIIYKNCAFILGQSRSFVLDIKKFCKREDFSKIIYFPNWAENIFSNRKKNKNKKNYFNILFAGNIGEAQDFNSIVKTAEKLKNDIKINWTILGDGRKIDWLKKTVKQKKIDNIFKILGRYPLKKMPYFYNRADALLVSLKDNEVFEKTIPGKLQSYLLYGKPILGMLNGEGNKIIKNSKSGYVVKAGDFNSLAKNIIKLKNLSDKKRKNMGENGKKYALKEFKKNNLINKLIKIFNLAINNNEKKK